ncbi:putative SUMO-specific isopeptidase USPL1 [Apostichopus japonicus]|uniref:Putative SUMO-specific isopeptidase USPL1 n=1 Tax=Stichopus japonicus TaxID=307972 RepID=A0A2G8JMH5_STIJA|nr:putative SUMO-specific isopeptidase USPL1 [Apostichopus japonicus]
MLRVGQSGTEPQDRLQHGSGDRCQSCLSEGRKSRVRKFQINPEECVFSCSSEKIVHMLVPPVTFCTPHGGSRKKHTKPNSPQLDRSSAAEYWYLRSIFTKSNSPVEDSGKSIYLITGKQVSDEATYTIIGIDNEELDNISIITECGNTFDLPSSLLEVTGFDLIDMTPLLCQFTVEGDKVKKIQFDKETYSNFGDPLELLQALGEIPSISLLQNDEENSLIELDRISSEDPELSEAVSVLDESRERIWEQLQPELRCKKDDEESPVFALPLLLRKNKQFEAHFRSSYHWQFYCSRCHFVEICHEKRVVLSLKTLNRSLSPTSYFSLRVCPYCQSPQGRNRLVIHKLPACPMFHFVDGLPPLKSWEQLEFHHGSYDYKVAAIIQYQQNPSHFVAWIRDNHRNLWLEGDDLKQPVVRWREEEPKFPASQAHLVMWERQGGCSECLEEQELVKNILVADNSELKQVLQRPQGNLMDSGEKVQVVNYLKAYIPKRTQDLSPIGAHASKATETSHQCTESSSRAKRKISEVSSVRSSDMTSTDAKSKNILKSPKRRPLIGHSLASKFAAFSETLQSFVEYKEMMEERKRKNSKILSRSTRMGSVSPLCSPSGSSEASSLPDSCQNMFPELDLILEDFRQTQGGMPDMSSELELFMQTL